MNRESASKISNVIDTVKKGCRSLDTLLDREQQRDSFLSYIVLSKIDPTTAREFEIKHSSSESFTLDNLMQFLELKLSLLETIEHRTNSRSAKESRSLHVNEIRCALCKESHSLATCNKFKNIPVSDRFQKIKELKLCSNCFGKGHFSKECKSRYSCKNCSHRHHTLLHQSWSETQNQSKQKRESDSSAAATNAGNSHYDTNVKEQTTLFSAHGNVLLSTAIVYVFDDMGNKFKARALLDSGSMSSFITTNLCEKLRIRRQTVDIKVTGVANRITTINSRCDVSIKSAVSDYSFDVSCLVVPTITSQIPLSPIDISQWRFPSDINLADPSFNELGEFSILLGSSCFWKLIAQGQRALGKKYPILQNSHLGWILAGPYVSSNNCETLCSNHTAIAPNDDLFLSKFWDLEQVPKERIFTSDESQCESHFVKTTRRDQFGRFIVNIPLRVPHILLGSSRDTATKCLISLEKRFKSNDSLQRHYVQFLKEYEELGHMSPVSDQLAELNYLPHHGVLKEASSTTKLRVVFNGSAPTSNGRSLNSIQLVGPTIQRDLFSILISFRQFVYAISADIEKMYRQVLVEPSQRKLQCILWRYNSSQPYQSYTLDTLTYGTASASFLAIRSLFQLADEHSHSHPKASKVIKNHFYVDDLLSGADSVAEAQNLCKSLSDILNSGCFHLRKWASNNIEVLDHIPRNEILPSILEISKVEKILGLIWHPKNDAFQFEIASFTSGILTKRVMLSDLSQIFDPLGLLAPCIIIAKILLQSLWLKRYNWDDELDLSDTSRWLSFRKNLPELNKQTFSRRVICDDPINIQLHAFCDASSEAYGCCIHVRSTDAQDNVFCKLLCAKTKVAPLKVISIPKLELCGALLLSRLLHVVIKESDTQFSNVYCWTDSSIVLGWLMTQPRDLKIFVSNRVSEILELTKHAKWQHVRSKQNPADLASRGINPGELTSESIWFKGPEWLYLSESQWPQFEIKPTKNLPELKSSTATAFVSINAESFIFSRYSNLNRLQRIFALVLRFVSNCSRKAPERMHGAITTSELKNSLFKLVKLAQSESYSEEFKLLKGGKNLASPHLAKLNMFIDDCGLIRVGGRISNSNYSYDKKHPLLLSGKHPLSMLIGKSELLRLLHAGVVTTLSVIANRFWIVSARRLVKGIVHSCLKCFRCNPKVTSPIMGNLPSSRIQISLPFTFVGMDYAGPFTLKNVIGRGGKTYKAYLCLFVCFATKALHLELVTSLTSEAFILTLRRFVGRRGLPAHLYSDNGTNFVGAESILKDLSTFLRDSSSVITNHATSMGFQMHFIPGHSPHFGGLWEARVKSVKGHLTRVIGQSLLTYETFYTILVQVESILNSRPLTPLSTDANDLEPLTPGHFLVGKPLISVVDLDVTHIPRPRLSLYQHAQQITQHFWNRWKDEYINSLQQRSKWKATSSQLKLDSLVLIKEDNIPVQQWKLGRIVKVFPGKDGVNRVAEIKTNRGLIKRSFSKICPLPVEK